MANPKDQQPVLPEEDIQVTRLGALTPEHDRNRGAAQHSFLSDSNSGATILSGAPFDGDATRLGDVDRYSRATSEQDSDRTQLGRTPAATGNARTKIGLVLNHIWTVRRLIAQGGMGEVYEGVESNTGEPVAIKFLLPRFVA